MFLRNRLFTPMGHSSVSSSHRQSKQFSTESKKAEQTKGEDKLMINGEHLRKWKQEMGINSGSNLLEQYDALKKALDQGKLKVSPYMKLIDPRVSRENMNKKINEMEDEVKAESQRLFPLEERVRRIKEAIEVDIPIIKKIDITNCPDSLKAYPKLKKS
jgi:hypothetical protein